MAITKRIKSLYDEWSRLDHMLSGAPKSVKKTLSARKKRVGELILKAEKRRK